MTSTVYDRNVDFYVDFVDRGLQSNRYLPLLTLMTDLIGGRLEGARVCDLCCGEGYLGRHLIARGAREVLGIDASAALLERATARANDPNLSYCRDDAQVLSSLAMMDVADGARCRRPGALAELIARSLKLGMAKLTSSATSADVEARPYPSVCPTPPERQARPLVQTRSRSTWSRLSL
jgi:SAM-dependent methyltransferase